MRKKKREAQNREIELQMQLQVDAARERAQEAEALRRRGYLTSPGHYPWRVPDDLLGLYLKRYPDLGADLPGKIFTATLTSTEAKANGPAKPARKRVAKKAATRTTKATT